MSTTITDYAGFAAIANDLTGDYELGNDIDASGQSFTMFGDSSNAFSGTLDGKGFKVTDLTLTVSGSGKQYGAVFHENTGTIRNIGFEDCVITVTSTDDLADVAGIAIHNSGMGTIQECHITGTITVTVNHTIGTAYVAGVCLYDGANTTIDKTYSTATITVSTTYDVKAAGFIYLNSGAVTKSYATGDVTIVDSSGNGDLYAGGFTRYSSGTITNCYARGDVSATGGTTNKTAGFAQDGDDTATNCYSTGALTGADGIGGFSQADAGTVTDCFWDTETSGTGTSADGTGKTTAQMLTEATFTNWDFCLIWNINAALNDGYPYLRWTGIDEGDETREYTLPPVFDEKGRVPKSAKVSAYRDDTGAWVEDEVLDSSGQATFSDLPNDTGISFHITWGGNSASNKSELLFSTIIGISEGGTGSSDVYNARSNLGLGSEDSPQFTAIELGHATDTTIARESAGRITIEDIAIGRGAIYSVAAADAPDEFKKQADKVCNGTNDHVEILAALAKGGAFLSPGTFYCEANVAPDTNQTLKGCGKSTILTTKTADLDIIKVTGSSGSEKTGILIADLCVDGNAGGVTNDEGILWTYVDKSEIRNVWSIDNGNSGIYLSNCDLNKLIGNTITGNGAFGIYTKDTSIRNEISENIVQGNSSDGIYTVEGNDNVISKNIVQGNADVGIDIYYSDGASVTGNIVQGNEDWGIFVAYCDGSMVTDNQCQGNGYDGIKLEASDDCIISDNLLTENSQHATNTYDDIYVHSSDYNNIQGNTCRAGGETNKPKYGINISNDTCNENKVINNDLYDDGFGTGAYNDSGTGTIYLESEDTRDFLKYFGNRTLFSGGAITAHGDADGSVAIASCTAWSKESDSDTADGVFFSYAGKAKQTLTDLSVNLIYLDYNGGTPQIVVATAPDTYGFQQDHVLIGVVFRQGVAVHILQLDFLGIQGVNRSFMHQVEHHGAHRSSGLVTSDGGSLALSITAGVIYAGLTRVITTVDGSTWSYWYTSDSGSTWIEDTSISALVQSYNDITSGKVALGTNRYGVHWVYVDYEGSHLHIVYGQGNYKANEAEEAGVPSVLPPIVVGYGILIAKIINQEDTNTLTITYPWTTVFTSSLATDHNSLANLTVGDPHTQYLLKGDMIWDAGVVSEETAPDNARLIFSSGDST